MNMWQKRDGETGQQFLSKDFRNYGQAAIIFCLHLVWYKKIIGKPVISFSLGHTAHK